MQCLCCFLFFLEQLSAFGMPGLGWAWVFAIGVLGVSSLGIYAACSEKALVLKTVSTGPLHQTR